ncbi:hypothetical protein AMATHDRAFT_5801 [Amanita thiersii Skay4041]|uniref:Uncharacterized protein n=1 Tax=Amanita thiersii Skay4041 TaxID=703135 RepID=A0A2A9NBR1_9AGAR|nr:hypothetical protein AMATHDRAFT_5801 [Amanita thiersii Skay4041]
MMDVDKPADDSAPKDCNFCKRKNAIPAGDSRKTCSTCREVRNQYARRRRDEIRAAKLLGIDPSLTSRQQEKVLIGPPRKKTKNRDTRKLGTPESPATPPSDSTSTPTKEKSLSFFRRRVIDSYIYQTAIMLCRALKDFLISSAKKFWGYYTIIAVDDVDHISRLRLVEADLREVTEYPFSSVKLKLQNNNYGVRATYRCECRRSFMSHDALKEAVPQTTDSNVLLNTIRPTLPQEDCNGSIDIVVKGDQSHPLGVLGQIIIVKIAH